MTPTNNPPLPEDVALRPYIERKLREEVLSDYEHGKPAMPLGVFFGLSLLFTVAFCGGLVAIVGIGIWEASCFL